MLLIHDLYLEYKNYLDPSSNISKPSNIIWMNDTIQKSIVMCYPQDRNINNKIFGGHLMRLAFELGYASALLFAKSKSNITLKAMDEVTFRRPVPIGCLLNLTSQIVYSRDPSSQTFQVSVTADVVDSITGKSENTNVFHMTFHSSEKVPRVLPQSYSESMKYIEGKRRRQRWIQSDVKK